MQLISRSEAKGPVDFIHPRTGLKYVFSYYLGDPAYNGAKGPYAVLVEFPNADGTILPHYHDVDQFQIVVQGNGTVGKHPVETFAIHYSDAFTTYGPIRAKGEGISFFTIRTERGEPPFYMPESRPKLDGRKRGREISVEVPLEAATGTRQVIETHADGLAAALLTLGPDETAVSPYPQDGVGQYYLLLSGTLMDGGKELPPMSLGFVAPGEEAQVLAGGSAGAKVLYMQLPTPRQ